MSRRKGDEMAKESGKKDGGLKPEKLGELLYQALETEQGGIMGLDTETETPGRLIVRTHGETLVRLMEEALEAGEPEAAEVVAAECVVHAETKDHMNWELLGEAAKKLSGAQAKALKEAYEEVEEEEDEHLYHTQGWARELWMQCLGLPAVLPPPEEEKDVKTAIGAARAKQSRKEML
jgi:hypothetical protein